MRKIIIFTVAIMLLFCIAGCNSTQNEQNTDITNANSAIEDKIELPTIANQGPYEDRYDENDHSTWGGYDFEKNYSNNLSKFVLDSKEFDFNQLTADDLIGMGYQLTDKYREPNDCKMIIREFISTEGAELFCVLNPDGRIEYMQIQYISDILNPEDPDAFGRPLSQTQCQIFNNIYPGMPRNDLRNSINNESIRIPTKEQDAVCSIRIKNEYNTISILLMHDYVENIMIVNNQLAKFK